MLEFFQNVGPSSLFSFIFALYLPFIGIISLLPANTKISFKKYFLVMFWVPLGYLGVALFFDLTYLLFFVISGFAGMVAESVINAIWDKLYEKPVWNYHDKSILNGYTSLLNFLPWAMGGFIFLSVGKIVNMNGPFPHIVSLQAGHQYISAISFVVGILLAFCVALIFSHYYRNNGKFLDVPFSLFRFSIFCIPIVTVFINLIIFKDIRFMFFLIFFASIGNITEYGYSKLMSIVFGHRLWTYNYLKIDNGHSSLTNLPLWAIGGLFFYTLADFIRLV